MSTVPNRLPVLARLQIASIQVLTRFVNSGAFRLPLMTFLHVWLRYRMYSLAFGASPKALTANPQTAPFMRQLEALRNTPIQVAAVPDTQNRLMQALTWGVASFALIALIQIVTQQPAHISPARWVACGCFALVTPWLAALGFAAHDYMDPQRPPTAQQMLNMHASIYAALLIFCLGLASLLWSYNPSIAGIFVLSCFVAVRRFLSFAKKRAASAAPPPSAIIRLP
jgi:hypothetical protein